LGALTESIVEFLAGDAFAAMPDGAAALAVNGFTDCLAVMVAGHDEPVTRLVRAQVQAAGAGAGSRMLLGERPCAPSQAALLGTTAAHALDFDDYAYSNHVSALLVPAIIAEAERSGASGRDMVAAYVAGFEVWGTVFKREPDHLHSRGWHPTGVFGPLGVAAALCRLRRLDADACRSAIGLAVASGGGVMDNFGTHAKPWQGGRAAEAGVVAMELAARGMHAGPDALDGSGGLMAALSPAGRVDRESPAGHLGHEWMAAGPSLNIKPHPTVGASQRAIDAAIQLHRDHAPEPGAIRRVTARVSEKHAAVMRLHRPRTAAEARFSLEFGVAAGLLNGRVGLAELNDGFVQDPRVQALLRKVEIVTGPDDDPSYPVGARFDTVSLELEDGRHIDSERVYRFRGHGDNPMSAPELRAKFEDCTVPQLGRAQSARLFESLRRLPELASAAEIPTLDFRQAPGPDQN
jgi:2-methylcitrate dehydratase PrpD